VSDDADAELVGAALETYCIAHCGVELNLTLDEEKKRKRTG
jgi:hypothetical protein